MIDVLKQKRFFSIRLKKVRKNMNQKILKNIFDNLEVSPSLTVRKIKSSLKAYKISFF